MRRAGRSFVGDIVLGRVAKVLPAVQAAFVEIGHERAGFLGAREARCLAARPASRACHRPAGARRRRGSGPDHQRSDRRKGRAAVRLGDDPRPALRAGALSARHRSVAAHRGRGGARAAASARRGADRRRANSLPAPDISSAPPPSAPRAEELREDAVRLAQDWRAILDARRKAKPPALLHRDLGPVARALRDLVRGDTARILIDDAEAARSRARLLPPRDAGGRGAHHAVRRPRRAVRSTISKPTSTG